MVIWDLLLIPIVINQGKVTQANGPNGWSLSRFLESEATGSISAPSLDGMLVHCRGYSLAELHLYPLIHGGWIETAQSELSCPSKQCTYRVRSSTLTIRSEALYDPTTTLLHFHWFVNLLITIAIIC